MGDGDKRDDKLRGAAVIPENIKAVLASLNIFASRAVNIARLFAINNRSGQYGNISVQCREGKVDVSDTMELNGKEFDRSFIVKDNGSVDVKLADRQTSANLLIKDFNKGLTTTDALNLSRMFRRQSFSLDR